MAIIPTFVRKPDELEVVVRTLETLRAHEPALETLVVDDYSPERNLIPELEAACERLDVRFHQKPENTAFSASVNVGLRECLDRGLDALLVNADIEFFMPVVDVLDGTLDSHDKPAAVVGPLLLYPNGLIQSAGTFLSLFSRAFDHIYRYAPGSLPEAYVPRVTLVTAALQFIRHSTLTEVGLYDEEYGLGFEDVDHGLRVFEAGLECVYNPAVRAIHHESLFRGQRTDQIDEWHEKSVTMLHAKHGQTPLGRYVLPLA